MRLWIKLCLFFSSYTPLFAIMVVRNARRLDSLQIPKNLSELWKTIERVFQNPCFAVLVLAAIVSSNVVLFWILAKTGCHVGKEVHFKRAESKATESLNYIVTYLIPFVAVNTTATKDIISLVILLATLAVVYIHSDLLYTNPVLNAFGYKLYKLEGDFESPVMLVSRRDDLESRESVRVSELSNHVFLEVRR